jgi:amidophosphoribosyltransferase
MCGIIGLINSPDIAEEIFLGLQNLQHRGQDGGGIVTLEDTTLHVHRGGGLLEIAFPPENFRRLLGSLGIGHTRYATIGKAELSMLQPFVSNKAGLGIAHNGNILNYHRLRGEVQAVDPNTLASGCDSELILQSMESSLERSGHSVAGLFASVKTLSETLVGSYSVVGVGRDLGLFAFRDPYGLRPLVMGKRQENSTGKNIVAFASETAALEFLGFTELEDVAPGEVILVTLAGEILRHQYATAKPRHCMFEWVYFARVESEIEELSVYQARFNLGVELADEVRRHGISPDIVVPVPETSRIAAIALAENLQVPFREVLIKNRYVNRTFILESQEARLAAIKRKLYPVAVELKDKKVLIVDDSIVRGNTAIKIIEMLRKSGAKEIYLASTCPPIQFPCYYGIDFPDRDELLAGKYPQAELANVLGVDALVYQTVDGLKDALKADKLCTACLTGEYPTDVTEGERFTQQRTLERKEVTVL